ncbi:MBL fold metallo-hydrolase [Spirochaetota bacterium]
MKKVIKGVLITLGTIIGVIIILSIGFFIKMKVETSGMEPLKTGEVASGVYSIKDTYVNLYLVKAGDKYIAIDAGNDLKNIKREMKKIKVDPKKVAAVFLTHTDYDHIRGIKIFKNAKVYISRAEEQIINGKTNRFLFIGNKFPWKYSLLDDKQEINISGVKIKSILVPGHTPGSMCYLVDDKYLFTGDNISLKEGRADLFVDFFNMDSETQRKSIKKLTLFPQVKYIFTAHHGSTDNYKKALEKWNK